MEVPLKERRGYLNRLNREAFAVNDPFFSAPDLFQEALDNWRKEVIICFQTVLFYSDSPVTFREVSHALSF